METTSEHGRIGNGKAVHLIIVWDGKYKHSACGSGKSSHMHNWRNPPIRTTTQPITCKKCLNK